SLPRGTSSFFFSSRRRHTRSKRDWSSDVCSSDLLQFHGLTLQPLVENAFIHGIEGREEGGVISIRIFPTTNYVIVEVSDDGVGMREETIEEILSLARREEEHVGHSTGIGLTNVIRRLQLFYQVDNLVDIDSKQGEGTTVRLHLPKRHNGSDSDASVDR